MELLREEVFVSSPQPLHMLSGEEEEYVTLITVVLSVGSKLNKKACGGLWPSVGSSQWVSAASPGRVLISLPSSGLL